MGLNMFVIRSKLFLNLIYQLQSMSLITCQSNDNRPALNNKQPTAIFFSIRVPRRPWMFHICCKKSRSISISDLTTFLIIYIHNFFVLQNRLVIGETDQSLICTYYKNVKTSQFMLLIQGQCHRQLLFHLITGW